MAAGPPKAAVVAVVARKIATMNVAVISQTPRMPGIVLGT